MIRLKSLVVIYLLAFTFSSCEPRMFTFKILDLAEQEKFVFECTPKSDWVFSTVVRISGNVEGSAKLSVHISQENGGPLWPANELNGEVDMELKSEWYGGDKMILVVKPEPDTQGQLKITCYF